MTLTVGICMLSSAYLSNSLFKVSLKDNHTTNFYPKEYTSVQALSHAFCTKFIFLFCFSILPSSVQLGENKYLCNDRY